MPLKSFLKFLLPTCLIVPLMIGFPSLAMAQSYKSIKAPEPTPLESVTNGRLDGKLSQGRTVNLFLAWNQDDYREQPYGLHWTTFPRRSNRSISLTEVYWNYHYPRFTQTKYQGLEKFLTGESWNHADEYGQTLRVAYHLPEYPDYISRVIARQVARAKSDGVMLDWWHNNHPTKLGKQKVAKARLEIARAVRARLGPDYIILANTNWETDTKTHRYINGVFLELHKNHRGPYTTSELFKIEQLLLLHEKKLAPPRLIALEPWRVTQSSSANDRNSPVNRRYARLFTAMSAVIPTNGYVLYADNNHDFEGHDHHHIVYGFQKIDLGSATSSYTKVRKGIGFKTFENGIVAYNLNKRGYKIQIGEKSVEIQPLGAVFCRSISSGFNCS